MNDEQLAAQAVDICYQIHKRLGPGLLERIYEEAFVFELYSREIPFQRQVEIPVIYKGVDLGIGYRADLILDNQLLIELKSLGDLTALHHNVVITYLRLSGLRLGLLINFNVKLIKEGIFRKILG